MTKPRYYIDERIGCIAVRDRTKDDPDYPGLHHDTPGVVRYWHGECTATGWFVLSEDIEAAQQLCNQLNNMIEQRELPSTGILQDWVAKLGLRQQGVLVSVVRGCDAVPKEDVSKALVRAIRGLILNTHCADPSKAVSFIESVLRDELIHRFDLFFKGGLDHYPLHWAMHLMHAVEILGYCHPDEETRSACNDAYLRFCTKLHVRYETEEAMNQRLNATETTFAKWSQV